MSDDTIQIVIEVAKEQERRIQRAIDWPERYARLEAKLEQWQARNEASMEASLLLPAQAQAAAANEPARQASQEQQ